MPYQTLAGAAEITVVTGHQRPIWCVVAPQNLGSGVDIRWMTTDGLTEIKRTQLTANVTGDPWQIGPYAFMCPSAGVLNIRNRNAGTTVYVFYELFYDGALSIGVLPA